MGNGEVAVGQQETATFGGGCFWCMQPPFDSLKERGVIATRVGYAGGTVPNPTYEEVCGGRTGHLEAVEVTFDPSRIAYPELLDAFWRSIDPTQADGQFADRGTQYRTVIFYHNEPQQQQAIVSKEALARSGKFDKPIATQIVPATEFYPAEEHHQDYYKKNVLHYQMYKVGSGRAGFLKAMWGDDESASHE